MRMRLPPRDQRDVLKIGELADDLHTTPRTIRLYEELGLIRPARTEGGTRLYRQSDAKRLAIALRLTRLGRELGEVQDLARVREQCDSGAEAAARSIALLDGLRSWIEITSDELDSLRTDLDQARLLIQQCAECPNRPNRRDCPNCPVDRHVNLTDLARLIWDPDSP